MDNPLFSVLIANYNNGRFLIEAIESVRNQTYSNWEIILVDDGSTDNSHKLYKQLEQDSRIHVFYNEENKGCGYTKRRCAELAKGEICGFLDPDDVLLPDALQIHIDTHMKHPGCSCVFSRYYHCDEHLNIKNPLRILEIPEGENYFTHRDYMPEHLVSFKREKYLHTIGIDRRLKAAVDQDLYFKLEEISPIIILKDFTYLYRTTDCQISYSNKNKALFWNLIVRYETCCRRGLDPEQYVSNDLMCVLGDYDANIAALKQDAINARSSRAYWLGRSILSFFKPLRKN